MKPLPYVLLVLLPPAALAAPVPVAFSPASGATAVCPDTPLRVTFDAPVTADQLGVIRITDADSGAVIETIDPKVAVETKTVGGLEGYHYYPLLVHRQEAAFFPRNGELRYGHRYAVTGIGGSAWTFSTRAEPPRRGASRFVVAADGSGDFCTVQAALDFIPTGNRSPVTVFIKRGTYTELLHVADKDNVTLLGEDRAQTVIQYADNNRLNYEGRPYRRGMFLAERTHGLTLANLTFRNTTPQGGSQAEAIILNGDTDARAVLKDLDLYSFQDTLQINGQAYVTGCHIEGDVDFIWGTGPCYFEGCDLVELRSGAYYTQIRNPGSNHGYVFNHCLFEGVPGAMGNYLSRIEPNRFPNSEVVLLHCILTDAVGTAAWQIQGHAPPANIHFWEYNSREPDGHPADTLWRPAFSRQLASLADAETIANYSSPHYVLGGWDPRSESTRIGGNFDAQGKRSGDVSMAAPAADEPIGGAKSFLEPGPNSAANDDLPAGREGNSPFHLPLILERQLALLHSDAILSVGRQGSATAYQWFKDGTAVPGATNPALVLTNVGWSDAGSYQCRYLDNGREGASPPELLTVLAPDTPQPPRLPAIAPRLFVATRYGASPAAANNAIALQRAIDAAAAADGGIVELPAAEPAYLSGPIMLRSNVRLQIDRGATLRMLPYGQYPMGGRGYPDFITAQRAHNVAITGAGTIDGQGEAWWQAFRENPRMDHRPFMIRFDRCEAVLLSGVTLTRSPMFHASAGADHLTVFGITIATNPNSPNTDGVDPAGSHQLIQNCSIADGDDNIAVKAGRIFCSDITVADCWFGPGHGVSVGGQSNAGLDGLFVSNCTFRGTTSALRLKADATQGGPVRNVHYTNLRMSGVEYPFVFYSYYNKVGNPGGTKGRLHTTPAEVNAWNATPPNSLRRPTLPSWRDIELEAVTADDIGGYSILWGLPLRNQLISGVRFRDVRFAGGPGLEIYDADNVQFDAATRIAPVITGNALAIIRQPVRQTAPSGGAVSFTVKAVGGSGTQNTPPHVRWTKDGHPLADGRQTDGSIISGALSPALTLSNVGPAEAGEYRAVVTAALDGYDTASGRLVPSSLPADATSEAASLRVTPR